MRRFAAGDGFTAAGFLFRVRQGRKGPNDLVLEMLHDNQWILVTMALGAVLADFFYQNEDVLYPPPRQGGNKYMGYLWHAAEHGWAKADSGLQAEKAQKQLWEETW